MSLKRIRIIDTNFAHARYSSDFQLSKYIEWDRQSPILPLQNNEIIFITDNNCYSNTINKNRIAWLMEPKSINPRIYDWISNNHTNFQSVLTYDKELLDKIPNGIYYPHGMCWIEETDKFIHDKSKLCSIIASGKRQTNGHQLRHSVISQLGDKLDVYGRGYRTIEKKIIALKDYAFSVTIENAKFDYYFTEKLLDCFMTGTVPIYWGCPSIGNFFNTEGMLIFDDINTLQSVVDSLTLDKYNSMLPAIKENFEKASKMVLAEDWIYENTNLLR